MDDGALVLPAGKPFSDQAVAYTPKAFVKRKHSGATAFARHRTSSKWQKSEDIINS